jgi:hypothetical protein
MQLPNLKQAWGLMEAEAGDVKRARELLQEGVWQVFSLGMMLQDLWFGRFRALSPELRVGPRGQGFERV